MTREIDDGAIERIVRAFDAAYMRYARAGTFEEQEDETSNLLHHLYRLATLLHGEPSNTEPGWRPLRDDEETRVVPALIQLRHVDVHAVTAITEPSDVVSDILTNLVGTLVWDIPETFHTERLESGARKNRPREILNTWPVLDSFAAARHVLLPDHGESKDRAVRPSESV